MYSDPRQPHRGTADKYKSCRPFAAYSREMEAPGDAASLHKVSDGYLPPTVWLCVVPSQQAAGLPG